MDELVTQQFDDDKFEPEDTDMDVCSCGRYFGKASGWDDVTDWGLVFYDFKSNTDLVPSGDVLFIDCETGDCSVETDGKCIFTCDVVEILPLLPKYKTTVH